MLNHPLSRLLTVILSGLLLSSPTLAATDAPARCPEPGLPQKDGGYELKAFNEAVDNAPPLAKAVFMSDLRTAKKLLAQPLDAKLCFLGSSLVGLAASKNDADMLGVLLGGGASPDYPLNSEGETPLLNRLSEGDFAAAQMLLDQRADLHFVTERGYGALHVLAAAEIDAADAAGDKARAQLDMARTLVLKGARVNVQDGEGNTPLMFALWAGNERLAAFLIERGADVNLANKRGRTPLQAAAKHGGEAIAALLRDAEASADRVQSLSLAQLIEQGRNEELKKALDVLPAEAMSATRQQRLAVTAVLAKNAAAITLLGGRGAVGLNSAFKAHWGFAEAWTTPLLFALTEGGDLSVAEALIKAGADINKPAIAEGSMTPLDFAVTLHAFDFAQLLLQQGANPNLSGRATAPLIAAVQLADPGERAASISLIRQLLAKGADHKARDAKGMTALHHAAKLAYPEAVSLLLEQGADASALDDEQHSPLFYAEQASAQTVIALLQRKPTVARAPLSDGEIKSAQGKTELSPLEPAKVEPAAIEPSKAEPIRDTQARGEADPGLTSH